MKPKIIIVICTVAFLLLLTVVVAVYIFRNYDNSPLPNEPVQQNPRLYLTDYFVIAVQPITKGFRITQHSIGRRVWVAVDPPPDIVLYEIQALNKVATMDILPGQLILPQMFIDPNQKWLPKDCFSIAAEVIGCDKTDHFYIYAFDEQPTQERWRMEADIIMMLTLAADNDTLYFWRSNNQLEAVDIETGWVKWVFKLNEASYILSSVNIFNNTLLFWNTSNNVWHALKTETGQGKWQFDSKEVVFGPILTGNNMVSFFDDEYWYRLDIETGHEIARQKR